MEINNDRTMRYRIDDRSEMSFPMWHNKITICHNARSTLVNVALWHNHWLLLQHDIDCYCNAMNVTMQNDHHCDTMNMICHIIIKKHDVTLLLRNLIMPHGLLFALKCDIIIE